MGGCTIDFAYTSFPWSNEASNKAVVTCVIVGFSRQKISSHKLYIHTSDDQEVSRTCEEISPYLTDSKSLIVVRQSKPISKQVPNLIFGNMPVDDGNLLFSYQEGIDFLDRHPEAIPFVKKFIGSSELMKGEHRYCLWLNAADRAQWSEIPAIMQRVEECRNWRSSQTKTGDAYKLREIPWSFRSQFNPPSALVIPAVTSENRFYVPMDFIKADTIVNNACFILPEASNYDFGILTSRMHMCWMRLTSGKMKSDYRYSRDLSYNTFVWPEVTDLQKDEISDLAKNIRRSRALHAKMCLGELYNPATMPSDLKELHEKLDLAVERLYRQEPFTDDEERLAFMLDLYSKAVALQENK